MLHRTTSHFFNGVLNGVWLGFILGVALLLAPPTTAWAQTSSTTIAEMQAYLEENPTDAARRQRLAERFIEEGQLDDAITQLERVLELRPKDAAVLEQLATLYDWTGRTQETIRTYERLLDLRPTDLELRYELSRRYLWMNQVEESIQQLETVVEYQPENLAAKRELAQQYVWTDRHEQARPLLTDVVEESPNDMEVRRLLADLHFWSGNPEQGIRHLEVFVDHAPADSAARHTLAKQLFYTSQPQRGLHHLEVLVRQHPDSRGLRRTLARRYAEHAQPDAAIEQYRWLVEHPPTDPEVKTRFLQHLLWEQRYDELLSYGTQMLASEPEHVERRLYVAQALAWSERPDPAIRHVDTLLTYAPDHTEALLLGGELQRWMPTQWPEGRKKLKRAHELSPENDRARTLLHGLRRDYGSMVQAGGRYETDSNERGHQYAPLRTDLWLGGLWRGLVEIGPHRFEDNRALPPLPTSPLWGYEGTAGVQTRFSNGLTLRALATVVAYDNDWTTFGGTLFLRQPLGPVTFTAEYERGEKQENATAVRARIRQHQLAGRFDLRIGERVTLSGDGVRRWLSDDNRQLDLVGTAEVLILRSRPTLAFRTSYWYEDSRLIFPDSRPYWTPDELSTLSGVLVADLQVTDWLQIGATYGLSEQEGTFGNNYGGRLRLTPGTFHSIDASLERYGAEAYSYRTVSLQYAYRF